MYITIILEPSDPLYKMLCEMCNGGSISDSLRVNLPGQSVVGVSYSLNRSRAHIYLAGRIEIIIPALKMFASTQPYSIVEWDRQLADLSTKIDQERARFYRRMTGRTLGEPHATSS